MKSAHMLVGVLLASTGGGAHCEPSIPLPVSAALSDPLRPPAQVSLDRLGNPGEVTRRHLPDHRSCGVGRLGFARYRDTAPATHPTRAGCSLRRTFCTVSV